MKEFEKELAAMRPLVKQKIDSTSGHINIEISKDNYGNSCSSHKANDPSSFRETVSRYDTFKNLGSSSCYSVHS
ncbi:unnamed protein product [Victoria cruziana]